MPLKFFNERSKRPGIAKTVLRFLFRLRASAISISRRGVSLSLDARPQLEKKFVNSGPQTICTSILRSTCCVPFFRLAIYNEITYVFAKIIILKKKTTASLSFTLNELRFVTDEETSLCNRSMHK